MKDRSEVKAAGTTNIKTETKHRHTDLNWETILAKINTLKITISYTRFLETK